jgi:hypothetical protein
MTHPGEKINPPVPRGPRQRKRSATFQPTNTTPKLFFFRSIPPPSPNKLLYLPYPQLLYGEGRRKKGWSSKTKETVVVGGGPGPCFCSTSFSSPIGGERGSASVRVRGANFIVCVGVRALPWFTDSSVEERGVTRMPSPPGRDDADGRVSCFLLSLGVNAPRGGVYRIAPRLTIRRKKVSTSSSEALSAAAFSSLLLLCQPSVSVTMSFRMATLKKNVDRPHVITNS